MYARLYEDTTSAHPLVWPALQLKYLRLPPAPKDAAPTATVGSRRPGTIHPQERLPTWNVSLQERPE